MKAIEELSLTASCKTSNLFVAFAFSHLCFFLLSGCSTVGIPPGFNNDTWNYILPKSYGYTHGNTKDTK